MHIGDAQASEGINEDKAENEIQRSFRMNGLTLNDENILEAMDSAFPGKLRCAVRCTLLKKGRHV